MIDRLLRRARRAGGPTDPDRAHAAALLERACGGGTLTLDEFGDRVGAVWAARSWGDLRRATADLPPAAAGPGPPVERVVTAVLGTQRRSGRRRVPSRLRLVAVLGRCRIDLRGAVLADDPLGDGVLEIRARVLLGSIRVVVPDGVEVLLEGRSLLGSRVARLARPSLVRPHRRPPPGLRAVRVTGHAVLGAVGVRGARPSRGGRPPPPSISSRSAAASEPMVAMTPSR